MDTKSGEVSVLYVDDELSAREVMAKLLRWKGLSVHTAGDGRAALQLFRHHKPDIIVTDIMMPEMNGIEMSREVRRMCSKIPIIIASAYLHEQYLAELKSLGISHFMQKPIHLERLVNFIETCCIEPKAIPDPKAVCSPILP